MRAKFQHGTVIQVNRVAPMWAGRYLDYVLEDGQVKRVQKTVRLGPVHTMTKRQAERKLAGIIAPINDESFRPKSMTTVEQASQKWMTEKVAHMKPASQASIKSCLKKIVSAFGRLECKDVKPALIDTWVNGLLTRYEWKTVKNMVTTFQMFWWEVEGWEFCEHDPFHRFKMPKRSGSPEQPCFTLEQVRDIISLAGEGRSCVDAADPRVCHETRSRLKGQLDSSANSVSVQSSTAAKQATGEVQPPRDSSPALVASPETDFQLMFRVLAETGLRGGELCGLFTSDVDLEARTITIRRSAYQGRVQSPKTVNAIRTVHISSFLTGYLKEYIDARARHFGNSGRAEGDQFNPATHKRTAAKHRSTASSDGLHTGTEQRKPVRPDESPESENIKHLLLFPFYESWKGLAWDNADVVEYGLKPVLKQMKIDGPRVGLHAFRHFSKSLMLHLGIPEKYRNERSGHSSGTGKMDLVYSHTDVARHKEYAEMIGRELFARAESEQSFAVGAD